MLTDLIGDVARMFPQNEDAYKAMTKASLGSADDFKQSFYEKKISRWAMNDKNVYTYRVFTQNSAVHGEYLDQKGDTVKTQLLLFNSTNEDIFVEFYYGEQKYRIKLEPNSYNTLQASNSPNSLRPALGSVRGLQLYRVAGGSQLQCGYIPLLPTGLGTVRNKGTPQAPSMEVEDSMQYVYKIFKKPDNAIAIDVQGMTPGIFDQPTNGRLRDITPVPCFVWLKSAAQMEAELKKNSQDSKELYQANLLAPFFDEPHSLWVYYRTQEYELCKKVPLAQTIPISLIRPSLSEEKSYIYILLLSTQDQAQAQEFCRKLHSGAFGTAYKGSSKTSTWDPEQLTKNIKSNTHGIIQDSQTRVQGFVFSTDTFLPCGVGNGPFYYGISSPVLRIDQIIQTMVFDKKWYDKVASGGSVVNKEVIKECSINLVSWIKRYTREPEVIAQEFKQYFMKYCDQQLVQNGALTQAGNNLYMLLLEGPVSIKRYPLMRKAGINYYIFTFGATPSDWPSAAQTTA